jgi:hypothetical protein
MNIKRVKIYYWTTLALSIIILLLNFGLILFVLGLIIILPVILLHIVVGLRLDKIETHKNSVIVSATTLLIFSLIRPDGGHTLSDTGLSSVLKIFGIIWGYCYNYENYFFFISMLILLFQVIMEIRLIRLKSD